MHRIVTVLALSSMTVVLLLTPPAAAGPRPVEWGPCTFGGVGSGERLDCTRLEVPVDRNDPTGPTLSLALARYRSTGTPSERIGTMVIGTGGPGDGLTGFSGAYNSLPRAITDRFDVVSWDPRGIGASTPTMKPCSWVGTTAPATGPVDWPAVVAEWQARLAPLNAACAQANEGLIEHVGTMDDVADLEALRQAIGGGPLTYWGLSYGTEVGYAYAATYPDHIRAMVLDGPVDPAATRTSLALASDAGERAFATVARRYPTAGRQLDQVMRAVTRRPVPVPGGERWMVINQLSALSYAYEFASFEASAAETARRVQLLHDAVFGSGYAKAAALYRIRVWFRGAQIAPPANPWVWPVISCLDYPQRPTAAELVPLARRQRQLHSLLAGLEALITAGACAGLDVTPNPVPTLGPGAGPAVPLLVAGSTGDGKTPIAWLRRMTAAFPASRNVVYEGAQHIVWNQLGNDCVDRPIQRYVLTGRLPATDVVCPSGISLGGLTD